MSLMTDVAALLRSEFNKIYSGTKGVEFSRRVGDDNGVAKTLSTIESERDDAINAAITALVNSADPALDTLNELAIALGNDENFATTVANSLALKANTADIGDLSEFTTEFNTGLLTSE